jgi:hypothetical protein
MFNVLAFRGLGDLGKGLIVGGASKRKEKPAAHLELVEEGRGDMVGCSGHHNGVKGGIFGPSKISIPMPHPDTVVPKGLESP